MSFELLVGITALAIGIAQVIAENSASRRKMIVAITVLATVALSGWALWQAYDKKAKETEIKNVITTELKNGPATYQELIEQRGLSDEIASNALESLQVEKKITSKVVDFELGGKGHRVRLFTIADN